VLHTAYGILHTTGDHEVQAVMVWDGLTTLVFTLLTSGILFYVAGADSNLTWFSTLFREAPELNS
jgi:hypothetical protein